MAKISNAEKAFNDAINKIEIKENLQLGVRKGQIVVLNGNKVMTDLTEQLTKAIGKKEDKSKYRFLQSIPIQAKRGVIPKEYRRKGQTEAGQLSDALGRYFEYLVFTQLIEQSKSKLNPDSTQMTPEEQGELSKMQSQIKYKAKIQQIAPELIAAVEQCAETAVKQLFANADGQGLSIDEIKADILYALAGSNPKGDIQIGKNGPTLELKFSREGDRVKFFTLSDLRRFKPTGLMSYSQKIVDKTQNVWQSNGEKEKPTNPWVEGIRTVAFNKYVNEYLMGQAEREGEDKGKALFKYLLAKGENLTNLNKKILLQIANPSFGKYAMTIDLDSYLDTIDQITPNGLKADNSIMAEVRFNSDCRGHLATLTTDRDTIERYSKSHKKEHTPVEEQSVTFLFFLQKNFYLK